MKKLKKLFTFIMMAFSLMGIFCGSILAGQKDQPVRQEASADFAAYDEISNSLPIYLKVDGKYGNDINEIFLQSSSGDQTEISIANDLSLEKKEGGTTYTNPAYYTEEITPGEFPQEFYYFSFTNTLSLYHNLSNTEIQSGVTGKNLLEGQEITNYTSFGLGDGFAVNAGGYFTPQKLNLSISLDTIKSETTFDDNKIILNEEGIYTLAIPVVVYHTTNNGATFTSLEEQTIYYTFMIFNADTYFKNVGDQNIQNVEFKNVQMSNALSSDKYSKYYFFNYSAASEGALPQLNYNHTLFKINIKYNDINGYSENIYIEYQNGELVYLNNAGHKLENIEGLPFSACVTNTNSPSTRVVFKDLGEYDVAFDYLYIVEHDDNTTSSYNVPIEQNETANYKDKNQKMFVYGYQAMFADYSTLDPDTNQTKDKELRTFELDADENGIYRKSADITSAVNNYYVNKNGTNLGSISSTTTVVNNTNKYTTSLLKSWALNYINDVAKKIEPISTNQPPIKFITNSKNESSESKIYKLIKNGSNYEVSADPGSETSFQGFNQNTEGTYLYVIQYTYDGYMTPSGTLSSGQTHYQIFFFTITSTVPSVTVTAADYDASETYINFKTIYTRGFTNKAVFILNNAKNNDFDAEIKIKITAYDYNHGTYIYQNTPIEELVNKDKSLEYGPYTYNWDNNNATPDETKYGILITNTDDHNAKWTITIESATTQTPSVQSFTIDTAEITNVKADNANKTDSSYFIRDVEMTSSVTNRPIAMSWSEKKSGAATYGYIKEIPFSDFSWTSGEQLTDTRLLDALLNEYKLLPTSSEIILEGATYNWGSYSNASFAQYENRIPSTLVKEKNGIYILQVYDQAGNYTFKIFMIDKTETPFVQLTITAEGESIYQLITNGTSISVPQEEFTEIFIRWGSYKGIHLKGEELSSYNGYEHSGIDGASFETEFKAFIQKNLVSVSTLSAYTAPVGYYFASSINDIAYIKEQGDSTYSPHNLPDHSYQIKFFYDKQTTGESKPVAREGTCKILLQDESNGYSYGDQYLSYINHPSSYLSFNVTSDLTKFTILDGGQAIEGESAFHITDLYMDASGNLTTNANGGSNTTTEYRKKLSYLPSINTSNTLSISFHPAVDNGLKLDFVNVQYYPYTNEERIEKDADDNEFHYFYKTISNTATINLPMFQWDDKAGYTSDSVVTIDLTFGQSTRPAAGKYVITRQYVQDDSLAAVITNAYDFFCRTMTFFVDTNGIVSSLEEVSANSYTAFESLIGGEILINTHGGNKEGNSDISISFPQMKYFGDNTYLNSGSFFSQSSFTEPNTSVSISRDTNKLPVELYIPKYKYTIKNEKDVDMAGNFNNQYKLTYNDYLSYYGNVNIQKTDGANTYEIRLVNGTEEVVYDSGFQSEQDAYEFLNESLSISAYELSAEIRYTKPGETKASKVYVTKDIRGTSHFETNPTTGNSYLQFYECINHTQGAISGASDKAVSAFSDVGKYTVILYQSAKDTTSSIYGFYIFSFEITSAKPSFDIIDQDNFILQSVGTEKIGNEEIEVYYTNSDSLTLRWEDPTDPYFAKVDQDNIIVIGGNQSPDKDKGNPYSDTIVTNGNIVSMSIEPNAILPTPTPGGCVEAFRENGLIISFQYQGHDDNYYKTTIKKVYFDTQAPTENLDSLMTTTESSTNRIFSTNFQKKEMRVYTDYQGTTFNPTEKVNETREASYITNVNTGVFKNYAFLVDINFFKNAQAKYFTYNAALDQVIPNDGKALSDIYFREIEITNYTQSTKNTLLNFSSFTQQGSTSIENAIKFRAGETEGRFYEIVEVDWAGNRTIYVVYLQNPNVDAKAIEYKDSKSNGAAVPEFVNSSDINNAANGFNIYANSEFVASAMDYNQDPWMFFTTRINGVVGTYFTSPDLSNRVYQIINNGNNSFSYVQKEIKDVVAVENSSSNKHNIMFADRLSGNGKTCYLTVMDASLIINKNVEGITETKASISINVPTQAEYTSTNTGYIFPVKVLVEQYDAVWKGFAEYKQTEYGVWEVTDPDNANNQSVTFSYSTTAFTNQLIITADAALVNQKMKFTVTDNFGGTSTAIILTGNAIDEDWSTRGDRFYIVNEADGLSYISSDQISYIFNDKLYTVEYSPIGTLKGVNNTCTETKDGKTGLTTYTFSPTTGAQIYDGAFQIRVYDSSDPTDPIKVYYIRMCNTLPHVDKTSNAADKDAGTIVFLDKKHENIGEDNIKADTDPKPVLMKIEMDGVEYVGNMTTITTYSRNVTVKYKNGTKLDNEYTESYRKTLTYSGYITADNGNTWTRMDDVEAGQDYTSYIISGVGTYYIIIKYDDPAILFETYKIFEVNILDSASSYYYITVFGQNVKKSDGIKYSVGSIEYEVTYIVSLEYADKYNGGLVIHENKELEVTVEKQKTIYLGQVIDGTINPDVPRGTIVTEIYSYSCEEAKGQFVIIYIPSSDNIVGTLNYELPSKNVSLKDGSAQLVVPHRTDEPSFDKLKISFNSYYGVEQNMIKPVVYKLLDGTAVKLDCEVFKSSDNMSYITLETAGTYYLQILDSCTPANSQLFTGKQINGYDYVEITFLPTVPFDVITKDSEGNRVVTAPIQKAIYNSEVTLQLTNISTYFSSSEALNMTATRNGQPITITPVNHAYTFTQPGYYTIELNAIASNGVPIRLEKYSFTIISKNESRYAFEFAEYGSYYIEKVIKDGVDVTEDLIEFANFKTIVIGNKRYLSSLSLNYLDQKTGRGRYEVVININNPSYQAVMGETFSFELWINTGKPPITVSIAEGASTSDLIKITFNPQTLYNTIGDCYIKIGSLKEEYIAENIASYGEARTLTIAGEGTYYIQVYTLSGQLLYSYKVTKTQPLNSFAILAIVLGVIAAVVVIIITIKLRKRQKVK